MSIHTQCPVGTAVISDAIGVVERYEGYDFSVRGTIPEHVSQHYIKSLRARCFECEHYNLHNTALSVDYCLSCRQTHVKTYTYHRAKYMKHLRTLFNDVRKNESDTEGQPLGIFIQKTLCDDLKTLLMIDYTTNSYITASNSRLPVWKIYPNDVHGDIIGPFGPVECFTQGNSLLLDAPYILCEKIPYFPIPDAKGNVKGNDNVYVRIVSDNQEQTLFDSMVGHKRLHPVISIQSEPFITCDDDVNVITMKVHIHSAFWEYMNNLKGTTSTMTKIPFGKNITSGDLIFKRVLFVAVFFTCYWLFCVTYLV